MLLDVRSGKVVEHRRKQDEVDQVRIELPAPAGGDDFNCGVEPLPRAVSPIVGERIEGVRNGDDARLERNARALEVSGIALSVPTFVVRQNPCGQLGVECSERSQHFSTPARMGGDFPALGWRQAGGIVDDVEQRFVNLADVVKQGDAFDGTLPSLVEPGGIRDDEGVRRHATDVFASLGVVRFDGVEQRLEAGGGESFDRLAAAALALSDDAGGDCEYERDLGFHAVD